jgi:HD-GYP domain-containing protein (c-di-GMP phosphodiesterase class II)
MRLVHVSRIADGMELARDIATGHPREPPLLRAGVRLTTRYAGRLGEKGVRAVWVRDELGEFVEPVEPLPPEVREAAVEASGRALRAARDAFARGQRLGEDVLRELASAASDVAHSIADCPPAALALDDLAAADAYTHRHSVQVATLGMLLARRIWARDGWLDWNGARRYDELESRLTKLGMGLLLHDIGKIAVPAEVLEKPDELTPEEYELVKIHPEAGVSLLPPESVSALVRAVVRSHHERWDGMGYPDGKAGLEIHEFARIGAVVDCYDAVTSERPYKAASPPRVGVAVIEHGSGTQFDPKVVGHFVRVVMPYPVGHEVRLADGSLAVVVTVDADHPTRPTVRFARNGTIEEAVVDMALEHARAA